MDLAQLTNYFSQPHWFVQTLISIGIALLINPLCRLARWAIRLLTRHPVQGSWFAYYFSTQKGERVFKEEVWAVNRGSVAPFNVTVRTQGKPPLVFKGSITPEKTCLLVNMSGQKSHEESVYIRFPFSVADAEGPHVGLGIQHDYDGVTEACATVISRKQMTESEVSSLIKKRTSIRKDKSGITCC